MKKRRLLNSLTAVGRKETESTAELLLHLAEVDSRKLYLKQGYSSLFDFCTRGVLRYSAGAAQRRIVSARAIARFPELVEIFLSKEINLCTLSLIGPVLTEENYVGHVEAIKGKSKLEVEQYLARFRPERQIRESIKPICIVSKKQASVEAAPLFAKSQPTEKMEDYTSTGESNTDNHFPSLAEQKFELRFQVKNSVMKKYRKVQAPLSGKYPRGASMEEILEEMLELYLEKHSPRRKQERRVARAEKKIASNSEVAISNKEFPAKKPACFTEAAKEISLVPDFAVKATFDSYSRVTPSRNIPQKVRDSVYLRDGEQCTYVAPDGKRCPSKHNLHIDHIVPYAVSQDNSISNLRLLCSGHNAYQAELYFGKTHMNKYLQK